MRLARGKNTLTFWPRPIITGIFILRWPGTGHTEPRAFDPPLLGARLAFARQTLGQEHLEQGLVRHIPAICQHLEILDH